MFNLKPVRVEHYKTDNTIDKYTSDTIKCLSVCENDKRQVFTSIFTNMFSNSDNLNVCFYSDSRQYLDLVIDWIHDSKILVEKMKKNDLYFNNLSIPSVRGRYDDFIFIDTLNFKFDYYTVLASTSDNIILVNKERLVFSYYKDKQRTFEALYG